MAISVSYEVPKINPEDVSELYTTLSALVYADLDKQYKEGKINGATYAQTYAAMMSPVISGSLQAVASILNNETAHDRCVKEEQCEASQAKTANDTCMASADCALKDSQKKKVDYETNHILPQQERLTKRQIIGFDDNKTLKGFNAGMSAWGLAFSSGLLEAVPSFVDDNSLTATYNFLNSPTGV